VALDLDRSPRPLTGRRLFPPGAAGGVTASAYRHTGLSVGQSGVRPLDSYRGGTWRSMGPSEATQLAPLPGDCRPSLWAERGEPGLTAWQDCSSMAVFRRGEASSVHCAAGAVRVDVTQLALEFGAYVIGTGRAPTVIRRSIRAQVVRRPRERRLLDTSSESIWFRCHRRRTSGSGPHSCSSRGTLVTLAGRPARPPTAWRSTLFSCPIAPLIHNRPSGCRERRLRTNIGPSRPSTTPSPPYQDPKASTQWEMIIRVRRERHAPIDARGRRRLSRSARLRPTAWH